MNEEELVPVESTSSGSAVSSSHGQEETKECSASYQKLVTIAEDEKPEPKVYDKYSEEDSPTITGFRFFDMEVLSSVFKQLRCGDCCSFSLVLMGDSTKRKGCASTLRLLCEHCGWKLSFCTSRKQGKSYEVNRRLVYGMRTIGKGYAGARKFCAIMNMPSPPTEKAFIFNSRVIGRHVKIIAEESMKKAGQDVYALKSQGTSSATGPVNCGISCDGTWQKRGYSSRNGCVTVISMDTGSQECKQCERHEHLDKASHEYQTWRAEHTKCKAVTVIRIFQALNIPPGKYTEEACKLQDQLRVDGVEYKSKASTKKRRKVIRELKKRKEDKNKQREGVNYAPGQF